MARTIDETQLFVQMAEELSEEIEKILGLLGGRRDNSIVPKPSHLSAMFPALFSFANSTASVEDIKAIYLELLSEIMTDILYSARRGSIPPHTSFPPLPCITEMVPFRHNQHTLNMALDDISSPAFIIIPPSVRDMLLKENHLQYPTEREHHAGLIFGYRYQGIPVVISHVPFVIVLSKNSFRYSYKDLLMSYKAVDSASMTPVMQFSKDLVTVYDGNEVRSIKVE